MAALDGLLSQKDGVFLQELVYNLQKANIFSEIETALERLKSLLPFDLFSLSLIEVNSELELVDYEQVCSYPGEWKERYLERKYWLETDVVHLERFKERPMQVKRWDDIYKSYDLTEEKKEFIGESRDFGLIDGYMYGLNTHRLREASLFTVSGNPHVMEYNERSRLIIQYITPYLHGAMVSAKIKNNQNLLTPTQLRVMELIALGLRTKDIATELEKSERAVEDVVRRAKEALDAHRSTDAVVKLIELGLISIR